MKEKVILVDESNVEKIDVNVAAMAKLHPNDTVEAIKKEMHTLCMRARHLLNEGKKMHMLCCVLEPGAEPEGGYAVDMACTSLEVLPAFAAVIVHRAKSNMEAANPDRTSH